VQRREQARWVQVLEVPEADHVFVDAHTREQLARLLDPLVLREAVAV